LTLHANPRSVFFTSAEPLAFFTVGAFFAAAWVCKVLQVIPIRTNADKRKTLEPSPILLSAFAAVAVQAALDLPSDAKCNP
jgi:hypothetical protein